MNAPTFRRIWAHSGSSLGSNTTHLRPRYRLSSMKSASRRTGTYLYSSASLVGAAQRARAPHHAAAARERAQTVDAERIEHAVLAVGQLGVQSLHAVQRGVEARRRLPDAALGVGPGHDPGDDAARHEGVDLPAAGGSGCSTRGK